MPNKTGILGNQKVLALIALLVLYVFFAIFGNNFVSASTTLTILSSSYYVGFLAIGVTFVIITGGIDLSIGAVMMCSALIGAQSYRMWGVPLVGALIICVLFATFCGLLSGILVAKFKLAPFIATLGMMMVSLGFGSIITNTQTKNYPTILEPDGWFIKLFSKTETGFPTGLVFLVAYFLIMLVVLNKTKVGRYIFAIGSNEEAVRLSGVDVVKWKIVAYAISGFSAGLAAILYSATYLVVIPNTGNGYELFAIAGVVIGGTSLAGGVGSLTGTMIGVFMMSILKNGLVSMKLPAPYQTLFIGLVVVGAALLDAYRTKRAGEVKKK